MSLRCARKACQHHFAHLAPLTSLPLTPPTPLRFQFLLQRGADAKLITIGNLTALDAAVHSSNAEVQRYLEENTSEMSPAHMAPPSVRTLEPSPPRCPSSKASAWDREAKAQITWGSSRRRSAAMSTKFAYVCRVEKGPSSFFFSLEHPGPPTFLPPSQLLLERGGVNINERDADGATCLMFAAMRGHTSIAQLLVDAGAELDAHDDISGWTALMQATYYGHRDIVVLLLVAGAPVQCVAPWPGWGEGVKKSTEQHNSHASDRYCPTRNPPSLTLQYACRYRLHRV